MEVYLKELIQSFIEATKFEFPGAEIEVFSEEKESDKKESNIKKIRVTQKTNDDVERKYKRFSPIIISIHEDFSTSGYAVLPDSKILDIFKQFIRTKHSQFNPRTTESLNHPHVVDEWIFPEDC